MCFCLRPSSDWYTPHSMASQRVQVVRPRLLHLALPTLMGSLPHSWSFRIMYDRDFAMWLVPEHQDFSPAREGGSQSEQPSEGPKPRSWSLSMLEIATCNRCGKTSVAARVCHYSAGLCAGATKGYVLTVPTVHCFNSQCVFFFQNLNHDLLTILYHQTTIKFWSFWFSARFGK